ncbi:MAG: glycosidase [Treponema sp. CETP13]|nr:MAG: glycosidase [Treponema sp. CETP13]
MKINRHSIVIKPDLYRVFLRPFYTSRNESAQRVVDSILALTEREVSKMYIKVINDFAKRHENIEKIILDRFEQVKENLNINEKISFKRKALIGSYFLMEYAPEAAALFNPSIVVHPDQTGVPKGSIRFILSLRATGEGHISSITFRTGILDSMNNIQLDDPVPFTLQAKRNQNSGYEKQLFLQKLQETGINDDFSRYVISLLPDVFVLNDLKAILKQECENGLQGDMHVEHSCQAIMLLAESNYEVHFTGKSKLSQRILFPSGPSQSNGIEDARFVRFTENDGSYMYYATYTAYDGKITLPQLLKTKDFINFQFSTLNGQAVQNKGMALFPRKINGKYAMLSRQDDENIFLMYSDNIDFWYETKLLVSPSNPWEYMKIGTCGSPIETKYGWLVISHGVGAIRRYSIGAFLLDIDDPSRVIARLAQPLLEPEESERDGYVPNVVYTCGAMVHGNDLIIPYAVSDYATKFATVNLNKLIKKMKKDSM